MVVNNVIEYIIQYIIEYIHGIVLLNLFLLYSIIATKFVIIILPVINNKNSLLLSPTAYWLNEPPIYKAPKNKNIPIIILLIFLFIELFPPLYYINN